MKFKEWSNSAQSKIASFFAKATELVIDSAAVSQDGVVFKFPDYLQLAGDEVIDSEEEPQRLAASVEPEPAITESYKDHPNGKGEYAFRSIAATPFAKSLTPRQAYNFKRSFTANLSNIAKELGLLFELEIYEILLGKGLRSTNFKSQEAASKKQEYYALIAKRTTENFAPQVMVLVQQHAKMVAQSIIFKSKSMLQCLPAYISFGGGNPMGIDQRGYRVTSDITVSCHNSKSVGFSTKFTTESYVRIADLWIRPAYALLGGKNLNSFSKKLASLEAEPEIRKFVIEVLSVLLNNLAKHPTKFNFVVNKLIFGTEDGDNGEKISNVIPVVRNYLANRGDANFSTNIQRNFITEPTAELKLRVKPGVDIKVSTTAVAVLVLVSYKEEKSTKIKFQVDADRVIVYMNDLF